MSSASSPSARAQYTAEQLEADFNDLRQSPLKPAIVAVDVPGDRACRDPRTHRGLSGRQRAEADGPHVPAGPSSPRTSSGTSARSPTSNSRRAATTGTKRATTIGQDGAEAAFEKDLRGEPRRETVEVDPTGQPVGAPTRTSTPGRSATTCTSRSTRAVQARAEEALAQGIESARGHAEREHQGQGLRELQGAGRCGRRARRHRRLRSSRWRATRPTTVSQFVGGISQTEWATLERQPRSPARQPGDAGPVRAGFDVQARHAVAMNQYGIRGPRRVDHRQGLGEARQGPATVQERRRRPATGRSTCSGALDRLERRLLLHGRQRVLEGVERRRRERGPRHPERRRERVRLRREHRHRARRSRRADPRPRVEASASRTRTTRPRRRSRRTARGIPADDIFTAVGQGDVAVTPLQLANAYAAFANGGTLWTAAHRAGRAATRTNTVLSDRSQPKAIRADRHRPERARRDDRRVRRRDGATRRAPRTRRSRASRSTRFRSSGKTGTAQVGTGRQGRHVAVRGVLPGRTRRSTSSSPSSKKAGAARRPRRRSCGESSRRSNGLPAAPPVQALDTGQD